MAKNAKPKSKCTQCGRITKKAYSADGRCRACCEKSRSW